FSFPVPIGRLRILCQAVLDTAQEKDRLPPLTDVERSVLTAIKADIAQGIKPTVRSVQDRLQYKSSNSARVAIDRLIKLGYIERSGSKRQIVVVTQPH
ncbi:MAG: hypothetical protein ACPGQQ_08185, partial [Candidatus Puniceispirillaceae bacterium]